MGSLDGENHKFQKDALYYEREERYVICENEKKESEQPCKRDTLVEAALKVLNAADPWKKAEFGDSAANLWFEGCLCEPYDPLKDFPVPDKPARLPTVQLVAPQHMPKLGRAGSLRSRQAILHSLVHTESWAIDLSWDIIARFGKREAMPRKFFDDFVKVAQDEGRHFKLLSARLEELGVFYGALPAHDGLWNSADATSKDLLARLAVEHCVHEARGLDVLPITISRFRKAGDDATADLLERVVYPEEITHCAAGLKWFRYMCLRSGKHSECKKLEELHIPQNDKQGSVCTFRKEISSKQQSDDGTRACGCHSFGSLPELESVDDIPKDVIDMFHTVVRKYFWGPLKPPFNEKARQAAGFVPEWYLPLTVKEVSSAELCPSPLVELHGTIE